MVGFRCTAFGEALIRATNRDDTALDMNWGGWMEKRAAKTGPVSGHEGCHGTGCRVAGVAHVSSCGRILPEVARGSAEG